MRPGHLLVYAAVGRRGLRRRRAHHFGLADATRRGGTKARRNGFLSCITRTSPFAHRASTEAAASFRTLLGARLSNLRLRARRPLARRGRVARAPRRDDIVRAKEAREGGGRREP
jgi:hypothetical protein